MNPYSSLNQAGPSSASGTTRPAQQGMSLRDIQMQNPRFLARHQEHQAKIHAEAEKKQKDAKFEKDKLKQLQYAKLYFDELIQTIQQYANTKFVNGLTFSNFAQVNEAVSQLNFYIMRLVETYDSYLKYMSEIQCYFDQTVRDRIENENGYDKQYKEGILKLSNDLYEKIGVVQGFMYPSVIHDIRSLFDTLERHGGPAVELFVDVDTDVMRQSYNQTVEAYQGMGYHLDIIEAQIKEVLGYDMMDIFELEAMKIK